MTCIYESRGGGLSVAYRPQRMRKNIKASLVNLTLNVRYKNDKKISNLSSPHSFFKLKMHQNPFVFGRGSAQDPAEGPFDTPRPPSRLGRGYPLLIPSALDAFGVSNSARRLGSQAPSTQNPGYASDDMRISKNVGFCNLYSPHKMLAKKENNRTTQKSCAINLTNKLN